MVIFNPAQPGWTPERFIFLLPFTCLKPRREAL